jgi:hypothetical protein
MVVKAIIFLIVLLLLPQSTCVVVPPAPYMQSLTGKDSDTGYREVYLCNNTFEISYYYTRGQYERMSEVLEMRIASIQRRIGYSSFEILKKETIEDGGISLGGQRLDFYDSLKYTVHFSGGEPRLPSPKAGFQVYVFTTYWNSVPGTEPIIRGDYEWPGFMRSNDRISFDPPATNYRTISLRLNVCKNNHRSEFALVRESTIEMQDGKVLLSRGGVMTCPGPIPKGINTPRDDCKLLDAKQID